MQTTIKDSNDLLNFLVAQSDSRKDWFGFTAQKLTAISWRMTLPQTMRISLRPMKSLIMCIR